VNEARENGFMFPELPEVEFWEAWTGGFLKHDKVSIKAWLATLPDLITMIIVCVLDCLLKMSSTETKLPVKVDKDYEVSLYGLSNIPVVLAGSSVGYMQLKFNVINYGVMGTVKDRRGGLIYAILCASAFFGPIQHFNYLPKAFLSSLLFFAGAGFVAENLWGSRKYLTMPEWMEVLLIVGVFIITKKILYAVIVGGFITSLGFIVKYARVPAVYGAPLRGSMVPTRERRMPLQTVCIQHIVSSWAIVVRLKGFLFFASANKLTAYLSRVAEQERNDLPKYRRLKFVVLDCGILDGMDASAAKAMLRMKNDLDGYGMKLIWTGVRPALEAEMTKRCVIDSDPSCVMETAEAAVCLVEQKAIDYIVQQQAQWLSLHPAFERNHVLIKRRQMYSPFSECVVSDSARFASPWNYCSTFKIQKYKTVLWKAGETKDFLFLVHSGAVGLFNNTFDGDPKKWGSPVLVYRHGSFLNIEFFLKKAHRYTAIAIESGEVVAWGEEQWNSMSRNLALMTTEIQRTAVAQMIRDSEAVGKELTRTKDDSDGLALVTKKTAKGSGDLPKELSAEVRCIESAAALERLGLFQNLEDRSVAEEHPGMPKDLLGSLRVAFNTFCVRENGTRVLPVDEVITALLYVGLDGSMLKNVVDHPPLSEGEFLAVAHEAAMARLSVSTKKLIEETFLRYDEDMSGSMDIDELANAFMHALGTEVSVGMIDGIANAYLKNKSSGPKAKDEPPDGLSLEDFTAIVARFCRKHENHVHVLRGIREMTGDDNFFMSGKVSVDMLTGNKYVKISEEEAKEMLFAADWKQSSVHPDRRDDDPIDILRILGMLTVVLDREPMPLPPRPVIKNLTKKERQGFSVPDEVPCDILSSPFSSEVPMSRMVLRTESVETVTLEEPREPSEVVEGLPDTCKVKLYIFLSDPNSSQAASVWSVVMSVLILVSVLTLILESMTSPPPKEGEKLPEAEEVMWFAFEVIFIVVFSVEYFLRLSVCDALGTMTRREFVLVPANICDLLAFLPTYIVWIVRIINPSVSRDTKEMSLLRIVWLIKLSRVARLFRVVTKSQLAAPVAMVLVVIWGIYMKSEL